MEALAYVILLCISYSLTLVIYRLWFSPVAHIPGPLLARATYWYEFYYDVILVGQYTFKVREIHQKYGPIVRVNPHEVHIHDPDFFEEIYTGSSKKRNRWEWFVRSFPLTSSMMTAVDHDDHRRKRAPIQHYLSKSKVRSQQPEIEVNIHKLLARFDEYKASGKPLPLDAAMFALSNDSIMHFAFGHSYDRISRPEFDSSFHKASVTAMRNAHMTKHLPIIQSIMQLLPEETLKANAPGVADYLQLQDDIKHQVRETQRGLSSNTAKSGRRTIFHDLLEDDTNLLTQSFDYLWENGVTVALGATGTTATSMFIAVFHLLRNADCLALLRKELSSISASQDMPLLASIEALPYLTAVIKESLRMSGTVTTRLQRIDPTSALMYIDSGSKVQRSYTIPPGTPMSSTVFLIHYDPKYYPEPDCFKPERWLKDGGNSRTPDQYFFPFLKGSMNCAGVNLAWAELYLLLFHMFKRGAYGGPGAKMTGDKGYLELFQTDLEDVEVVGDGLGPIYRNSSHGVRVLVKPF